MKSISTDYDVVIFGSGFAGSTAALPLAQNGLKVLVVELRSHPRYVVGESTVPGLTIALEDMAEYYKIPEFKNLTRYNLEKDSFKHGLKHDFCKLVFMYLWHEKDKEHLEKDEWMTEVLRPPLGPDTHVQRKIFDHALVSLYPKYHVDYVDNTSIQSYERTDTGYSIILSHQKEKKTSTINAKFIIDATGQSSYFGRKLGFLKKEKDITLRSNTAAIYSQFKLSDLPDLDEVCGGPSKYYRYRRASGTMHHCFEGGWIWVIPFDYDVVSVGLIIDRNKIKLNPKISPKEEFYSIINQFPTVKKHIGKLTPVLNFIRTEREQMQATTILGDRIILTPFAASFISALMSTGMQQIIAFNRALVPLLTEACKSNNFSKEHFQPLEDDFFRDIDLVDIIVAGITESFRHPEVMKQFLKITYYRSIRDIAYATCIREESFNPKFSSNYGPDYEKIKDVAQKMYDVVFQLRDDDQEEVAKKIQEIIEPCLCFSNPKGYDNISKNVGSGLPYRTAPGFGVFDMLRKYLLEAKQKFPPEKVKSVNERFKKLISMQNTTSSESCALPTEEQDTDHVQRYDRTKLPWGDDEKLK